MDSLTLPSRSKANGVKKAVFYSGINSTFGISFVGLDVGRKLSLYQLWSKVMDFVEICEGFFLHQSFFKQFTHIFPQIMNFCRVWGGEVQNMFSEFQLWVSGFHCGRK